MRHVAWRPRNGLRLSAIDNRPPKAEIVAQQLLGKIPKIFLYPVWGLLVAALIAIVGRGELLLKSVGLILVAVWLAVDFWAWLIKKHRRWTYVIGWTSTSLLFIGVMSIMWWWLDGKLQDQRENVQANLSATATVPPSNHPYWSTFTVRNGGATGIGGRAILCSPVLQVGENGSVLSPGLLERFPVTEAELAAGNSESATCLAGVRTPSPRCIDMELEIRYALTTQPNATDLQKWRFVAMPSAGIYQWHEQPVEEPHSYCAKYLSAEEKKFYWDSATKP